jgi:urease accessory protein
VRAGVHATTCLTVDTSAAGQRVRWAHAWPVVLRQTGPQRVHLVHAAGGPLGGDELALAVDIGAGAVLAMHSAGATLVQPGAGEAAGVPARWAVTLRVGAGACLDWAPQPTVVSDGAALESSLRVELGAGAGATIREVVVLGRHGQRGGRHTGALEIVVDGVPLLVHTTVLDGADPGLCGPAGTAGARAVGTLVFAGAAPRRSLEAKGTGASPRSARGERSVPGSRAFDAEAGEAADVRWAWTSLDGPGAVLLAVGTPSSVVAVLDAATDTQPTVTQAVGAAALGGPGRLPQGDHAATGSEQGHPAETTPAVPAARA